MRKKIVAGNWKMNTTVAEGVELAKAVAAKSSEVPSSVKLIIAPPFTHLVPVAEAIKGTSIGLSAQNCADKEKGAYTGEVAADMLVSAGCQYTILGQWESDPDHGILNFKTPLGMKLLNRSVGDELDFEINGTPYSYTVKDIKVADF